MVDFNSRQVYIRLLDLSSRTSVPFGVSNFFVLFLHPISLSHFFCPISPVPLVCPNFLSHFFYPISSVVFLLSHLFVPFLSLMAADRDVPHLAEESIVQGTLFQVLPG